MTKKTYEVRGFGGPTGHDNAVYGKVNTRLHAETIIAMHKRCPRAPAAKQPALCSTLEYKIVEVLT